jgi:hypothetical protein
MSREIEIDPEFLNIFDLYFNCDLIDLSDPAAIRDATDFCATDSIIKIKDLDALISALSDVLKHWNPHTVMQFIDTTNTDWLFDKQTEQTLKVIVSEITQEFKQHRLIYPQK